MLGCLDDQIRSDWKTRRESERPAERSTSGPRTAAAILRTLPIPIAEWYDLWA